MKTGEMIAPARDGGPAAGGGKAGEAGVAGAREVDAERGGWTLLDHDPGQRGEEELEGEAGFAEMEELSAGEETLEPDVFRETGSGRGESEADEIAARGDVAQEPGEALGRKTRGIPGGEGGQAGAAVLVEAGTRVGTVLGRGEVPAQHGAPVRVVGGLAGAELEKLPAGGVVHADAWRALTGAAGAGADERVGPEIGMGAEGPLVGGVEIARRKRQAGHKAGVAVANLNDEVIEGTERVPE